VSVPITGLNDFFTSFNFKVEINNTVCGFKSVSGLKTTASFEAVAVGGMNDGPVMLPVPNREPARVTLEKGRYFGDEITFPLTLGAMYKSIAISPLTKIGLEGKTYTLSSAFVESIETSPLNATDSGCLIDTVTVVCRKIT